ncbi:hypothetical protein NEPAR04_2367 [Nematocida parisii]|nr:hypothetical protein NEPAR04_2367 [Nematocida parisii]
MLKPTEDIPLKTRETKDSMGSASHTTINTNSDDFSEGSTNGPNTTRLSHKTESNIEKITFVYNILVKPILIIFSIFYSTIQTHCLLFGINTTIANASTSALLLRNLEKSYISVAVICSILTLIMYCMEFLNYTIIVDIMYKMLGKESKRLTITLIGSIILIALMLASILKAAYTTEISYINNLLPAVIVLQAVYLILEVLFVSLSSHYKLNANLALDLSRSSLNSKLYNLLFYAITLVFTILCIIILCNPNTWFGFYIENNNGV